MFVDLFMMAILTGGKRHLIVVLICISLMALDAEHPFMSLGLLYVLLGGVCVQVLCPWAKGLTLYLKFHNDEALLVPLIWQHSPSSFFYAWDVLFTMAIFLHLDKSTPSAGLFLHVKPSITLWPCHSKVALITFLCAFKAFWFLCSSHRIYNYLFVFKEINLFNNLNKWFFLMSFSIRLGSVRSAIMYLVHCCVPND